MKADIYPGILSHTLEEYASKLELVESSGSTWAHIDIMDGQFVPSISVMPHEIMGVSTELHLEAHMMTFRPERYYPDLTAAGVTRILIHREAYETVAECNAAVKHALDYFSEVGVVLSPETALEKDLLPSIIQCMGVHPGASGQALLEGTYDKIKTVHAASSALIAVDGGVTEENIKELQKSGAVRFVISSHIFVTQESVATHLQNFTQLVGGL